MVDDRPLEGKSPGGDIRRDRQRAWVAVALLGIIGAALWGVASHTGGNGAAMHRRRGSGALQPRKEPLSSSNPGRHVEELRGQVTDPSGKALENALVTLGGNECLTDDRGRFRLPRATSTLKVSLEGYFPLALHAAEHGGMSGSPSREVTLVLFPGGFVKGRVTSESGLPVHGARIVLERDLHCEAQEVTSDTTGRWQSPLLEPGPIHILVRHPRYRSMDRLVFLDKPGAVAVRDMVLLAGDPFQVKVVDQRGRPLPDAQLWLDCRSAGAGGSLESRYLGRSDDLGELADRRETGRRATVRARLPGYREGREEVRASRVRLELAPAPVLEGQVIHERSGLPVTPSAVDLQYLRDREFLAAPHRGLLFHSLDDGKIRIGLPPVPGTYRVAVAAEGHLVGMSEPVEFDGRRSPPPFLVRLERRLRLAGTVRHSGRPLA